MEFPPLVYNTPLVYWTTFKESKSPLCLLTLEGTSLELTPPPPLLVCTSPAWFLVSVQVWYAQAGNHASHYLPLSFAGPKAQPVRGLCKDPRDHPRLCRLKDPCKANFLDQTMVINCPFKCREHSQMTTSYQVKQLRNIVEETFSQNKFRV